MWEEYRFIDVKHETSRHWERILRADLGRWLDANGAFPQEPEPDTEPAPVRSDFFSTIQTFANPEARDNEPHWCPFFMDFDSEVFDTSLREARFVVDYFLTGFEVTPDVWFSGNRGFHITVDAMAFGATPSPELTYIWRHLAERIATQLGLTTLDKRVYSRRRMWRIDGTRHAKSGLFKRRLDVGYFRTATAEAIRELASEPADAQMVESGVLAERPGVQDVQESNGLKDLFRSASAEFQDRQKVIESTPVEYFFQVARRRVLNIFWRMGWPN